MWSSDSCISTENPEPKSKPSPASRGSTITVGMSMREFHGGTPRTSRTCRRVFRYFRAIEDAASETAALADLISVAVLRRHLETMDRLDIEYDFLPRESEILHLHFWDSAFTKLKNSGVLTFEDSGKNKGCWVMRRAGTGTNHVVAEDSSSKESSLDVVLTPDWNVRP